MADIGDMAQAGMPAKPDCHMQQCCNNVVNMLSMQTFCVANQACEDAHQSGHGL